MAAQRSGLTQAVGGVMQYAYGNLLIQLVSLSQDRESGIWNATMRVSGLDGLDRPNSHEKTFNFGASDVSMAENMAANLCNRWIEDNLELSVRRSKNSS